MLFMNKIGFQHKDPELVLKDNAGGWLLRMEGVGERFLQEVSGKAERQRKVRRTDKGQLPDSHPQMVLSEMICDFTIIATRVFVNAKLVRKFGIQSSEHLTN